MLSSAVRLPLALILPLFAVMLMAFVASSPVAFRAEPLFKVASFSVAVRFICLALMVPSTVMDLPLREMPSAPVTLTWPEATVMLWSLATAKEFALKAWASVPPPPKVTLLPASLTFSIARSPFLLRTVVLVRVRLLGLSVSPNPAAQVLPLTVLAAAICMLSAWIVPFSMEVVLARAVTVLPVIFILSAEILPPSVVV